MSYQLSAKTKRATELIFRLAQAHDSMPLIRHEPTRKILDELKIFRRFLRPARKPFEELCPRI